MRTRKRAEELQRHPEEAALEASAFVRGAAGLVAGLGGEVASRAAARSPVRSSLRRPPGRAGDAVEHAGGDVRRPAPAWARARRRVAEGSSGAGRPGRVVGGGVLEEPLGAEVVADVGAGEGVVGARSISSPEGSGEPRLLLDRRGGERGPVGQQGGVGEGVLTDAGDLFDEQLFAAEGL